MDVAGTPLTASSVRPLAAVACRAERRRSQDTAGRLRRRRARRRGLRYRQPPLLMAGGHVMQTYHVANTGYGGDTAYPMAETLRRMWRRHCISYGGDMAETLPSFGPGRQATWGTLTAAAAALAALARTLVSLLSSLLPPLTHTSPSLFPSVHSSVQATRRYPSHTGRAVAPDLHNWTRTCGGAAPAVARGVPVGRPP